MAENTTNLPPSDPSGDVPFDLDEDIFDFEGGGEDPLAAESQPAEHNAPVEDEDLFDFEGEDQPADASTPSTNLTAGAENLSHLVEATEPEKASGQTERAQTRPAAATPGDLFGPDEDLFDFDNLLAPSEFTDGGTLKHEDLIDKVEPEPTAPVSTDEDTPTPPAAPEEASAGQETAAPAAPAASTPVTPSVSATPEHSDSSKAQTTGAPLGYRSFVPEEVLAASLPAERGWDRRVVWSVAAVFLLVNLSLILVATSISQSLNTTLNGVREDLSQTISQGSSSEAPVQITLPPVEYSAPVEAPATAAAALPPSELANVSGRELELAHQEIASAAFPAARRRLYRLLANRDRLLVTADVLAEAEFLIAESYFQEAKNRDSVLSGEER